MVIDKEYWFSAECVFQFSHVFEVQSLIIHFIVQLMHTNYKILRLLK